MKLATIPFSGFYYSLHDSEIDNTIEQMFADRETGCTPNPGLQSALFNACNFSEVHNAYAAGYCKAFADEFNIPSLKFESLNSPREYNFTTDRIFTHISEFDICGIALTIDRDILAQVAADRHTSRDGFISFYSPNVENWGDWRTWDHNQIGTLLQAYANQQHGDEFDQWAEYGLMESARCNGYIDSWIVNATPNISRLFKIHDYLETRAAR